MSDVKGSLGSTTTAPKRAREMKGSTAGEPAARQTPEICANCGATLRGPYCSACGQAGHIHSDLRALLHDLAHGVFHFEGKFWRTLVLLAWQPGERTRRYIEGERTTFVSPIGLFLFSVFLMFAVTSNLAAAAVTLVIAPGAAMSEVYKWDETDGSVQYDEMPVERGARAGFLAHFFNVAPANRATPPRVVWAALRPSRKSLSE